MSNFDESDFDDVEEVNPESDQIDADNSRTDEDEYEEVEENKPEEKKEVKRSLLPDMPLPPIMPKGVSVITEDGPFELELEDSRARGPWIKYTGPATVRIMDADAWKSAGVKSTKYCEWNYLNKKRLPMRRFTDDELAYLLRRDGRFKLVEDI